MSINLDKLSEGVEYNILLIGYSGVGKSTFINAFVNYLKYSSLDDAMEGECEEVIATRFRLKDGQSDEMLEIESGNDENEVYNEENRFNKFYTKTRNLRVYSIHHNNKLIRLIDTHGIEMDDFYAPTNNCLHAISQFLINFVKLHAIVMVTSCDNDIRYCDLGLLQTICKSASTNIVCCFVNQYNNKLYKDDIFEKMKPSFEKYTTITPHPGENLLALDNCAYQCLIAHRQGHSFSDERINEYRTSWNEASEQIQNMINCVVSEEKCECTGVL